MESYGIYQATVQPEFVTDASESKRISSEPLNSKSNNHMHNKDDAGDATQDEETKRPESPLKVEEIIDPCLLPCPEQNCLKKRCCNKA